MNKLSGKIWFSVVPVIVVLVVFVVFYKPDQKTEQSVGLSVKNAVLKETDTDGDGLKDWEELIWKLDPQSEDTDGDGEGDSNFVQKQLNSGISSGIAVKNGVTYPTESEDEISQLSKDLFSEYIDLKQNDALTPININQVTGRLAEKYAQDEGSGIKQYDISDTRTFSDSDLEKVRQFGEKIAVIETKYKDLYRADPIALDQLYVSDKLTEQSLRIAQLYKSMAEELILLESPQSAAEAFVYIINGYLISAGGFEQLGNLYSDPIASVYGIQRHIIASEQELDVMRQMAAYFRSSGIIFNNEPAASFWNSL